VALTPTGKVLYSATFVLLLPLALIAWASATAKIVHLPAIASLPLGLTLAILGALLLLSGMRDLWIYGGGLPMNAHPPPRYVDRGVYRLLPHPIYTGFCILCLGTSISAGSASGLWLISPIAMLGCAALVIGYERHDLRERFGSIPRGLLPADSPSPSSISDIFACYTFAIFPWFVLFAGVLFLGKAFVPTHTLLAFSNGLFFINVSKVIVTSAFVGFALAPFVANRQGDVRRIAVHSLAAMGFACAVFLAMRIVLPHLGYWTQTINNEWSYFPSVSIIWGALFAGALEERWPSLRWISRSWLILLVASCILADSNGVFRVLGGVVTVTLAWNVGWIWQEIRTTAERVANSWREWRIGPVRIINHGAYAGLGAFVAIWMDIVLAGPGHRNGILFASTVAVAGASLWAQYVEGSPQLLRPFGFYGGLLGGTIGALAAPLFHTSIWLLLAVFSVSGPWAQAAGRLRCLVQGCCHGRPAAATVGIRYVHPNSRVCRLTSWTAVPLHPTPVYSILWNLAVALIQLNLWMQHTSLQLIVGLYFILNGIGRFAEEAWRGEPQTKVVAGLRLYQWAAVASVVLGALFTCFDNGEVTPAPIFQWNAILPAAVFGCVVFCAMGVDFPNSRRRYSRLT
jgi:protein-S-isoprenylcysteine O-methyltransferase Ste14